MVNKKIINKKIKINRSIKIAYDLIKKAKGLPKPCDLCGERFQPTGKFQKLCYDCYCEKHQKRAVKFYGHRRKKYIREQQIKKQ